MLSSKQSNKEINEVTASRLDQFGVTLSDFTAEQENLTFRFNDFERTFTSRMNETDLSMTKLNNAISHHQQNIFSINERDERIQESLREMLEKVPTAVF